MATFGMVVPRSMRSGIVALCCLFLASPTHVGPAHAQPAAVDLELILAVDVSGSIDPVEAKLQREGYMGALSNDRVIEAIGNGVLGRIALTYVEWAGYEHQLTVVDWRVIATREDAEAFVGALAEAPLQRARRTSLSGALEYTAPLFAANDFEGTRQVVDVSGDGPNNSGPMLPAARDAALAKGIVINGLPIINERPNPYGLVPMQNLDLYYKNCVIGGPGAFIIVARSFDDFASAVLSKLILEITDLRPAPNGLRRFAGLHPLPAPPLPWLPRRVAATPRQLAQTGELPAAPAPVLPPGIADCDAGERQWQRFRQGYDGWP